MHSALTSSGQTLPSPSSVPQFPPCVQGQGVPRLDLAGATRADPVPTSPPRAAAAAWVGEETTTCLVFVLGGAWPLLSFIFILCLMPGCAGLLAQLLPAGDGSALLRTDPLIPQGRACCLSLGSFCPHVKTGGRAKICPGSPGCDSSSLHHLDLRELPHCLSRFPSPKPGQLLRVPTAPWCCCTACGEVLGWV